jgi:hypothetical protein
VFLCGILLCLPRQTLEAANLRKSTSLAFDRYVSASEHRMQMELQQGPFLFIDAYPGERREQAYAQLHEGKILVRQMNTQVEGQPIKAPGGLIHDWSGVVFVPGVSLAKTLAVAQDYDNYQKIYAPEVRRSRLLQRNGENFKVFLQFYKRSLVTVIINAYFDIDYQRPGANRVISISHSTRLAEVDSDGAADEQELPADAGHGYLWRLNTYWRLEEKDGGVYVQLESIALSRNVPAIFAWLVNPLLRSIPRGTITSLLGATRTALTKPS